MTTEAKEFTVVGRHEQNCMQLVCIGVTELLVAYILVGFAAPTLSRPIHNGGEDRIPLVAALGNMCGVFVERVGSHGTTNALVGILFEVCGGGKGFLMRFWEAFGSCSKYEPDIVSSCVEGHAVD